MGPQRADSGSGAPEIPLITLSLAYGSQPGEVTEERDGGEVGEKQTELPQVDRGRTGRQIDEVDVWTRKTD
ncbi:hypothetical protein ROHU_008834 [Labeo rohita]|uniref:Uncharacterized protein n=1 Tax=Labeo rohita TaxID=84645 RepID=A0A498M3Q5_LABRO|nr:hypothetical protein ROHU_008834 [Labeo rohita]